MPPPRAAAPVGVVTRGTTGPQRLRRIDRWLAGTQGPRLRAAGPEPVVVDLGFGAAPTTTVELAARLRTVRPDVRVVGIEIDPARVAEAQTAADPPALTFVRGGFELAGERPVVVRALNVLRQYDESAVTAAWATTTRALAPGGLLVDGTCDELGRLCSWIAVEASPDGSPRPRTLVLAARTASLGTPGDLAARLPKALIHRNVPAEPIGALLAAADAAWATAAPLSTFGPRQRWRAMAASLRDGGWPIVDGPARWRLGELAVAWDEIAPGRTTDHLPRLPKL